MMTLTWRDKLQLTTPRTDENNQTTTATNYFIQLEDGPMYKPNTMRGKGTKGRTKDNQGRFI